MIAGTTGRVWLARVEACARRGELPPPPLRAYKPHLRMHVRTVPYLMVAVSHIFPHPERGKPAFERWLTASHHERLPAIVWRGLGAWLTRDRGLRML